MNDPPADELAPADALSETGLLQLDASDAVRRGDHVNLTVGLPGGVAQDVDLTVRWGDTSHLSFDAKAEAGPSDDFGPSVLLRASGGASTAVQIAAPSGAGTYLLLFYRTSLLDALTVDVK